MNVHKVQAESIFPKIIAVRFGDETETRVMQQAAFHLLMREGSLNRTMDEAENIRRFGNYVQRSTLLRRAGAAVPYLVGEDAEWFMDRVEGVRSTDLDDDRTQTLKHKVAEVLTGAEVEVYRVPDDLATLQREHLDEVSAVNLVLARLPGASLVR